MRKKGGILEIGLESLDISPEKSSRISDLIAGPYIQLTVRDTGHGIPSEVLNRVFEPYFTTKGIGRGYWNGLGGAPRHHN